METIGKKVWETFTFGNLVTIILVLGSWLVFAIQVESRVSTNEKGIHEIKAIMEKRSNERDRLVVLETDIRYIRSAIEKLEAR
jgi:hypothetical protein